MHVSALFIYPVKAARGVFLGEAAVEPRGLAGDRRWLIVDAEDRFVTQRDHPVLATVVGRVTPEGLRLERAGMEILVATPHPPAAFSEPTPSPQPQSPASQGEGEDDMGETTMETLGKLPMPPGEGEIRTVTVWRSQVEAIDAGDEAAAWVSQILGVPARLVHMGPESRRAVDPDYGQPGDEVSFADGFPMLLTNEDSLADLNLRMPLDLPMNRFRPNIVVAGAEAWGEDHWKLLRIGDVEFRNVKPCGRCLVTTTDQLTGQRMGEEPLRTLATFRKEDGKVFFGTNLIPNGTGVIRVGDPVEVLQ